jgi:uncharacterized protein (PEP-CTERM system associated)
VNRLVEFDDQRVLRFGVSATYEISPTFSVFGGVDYIPTSYAGGRVLDMPGQPSVSDSSTDIINAYLGLSMRFNDYMIGSITYNYTDVSSDFTNGTYTRNRISVGVSAEF